MTRMPQQIKHWAHNLRMCVFLEPKLTSSVRHFPDHEWAMVNVAQSTTCVVLFYWPYWIMDCVI